MDRVLNAGLNNPLVVAFLFGMTTGISLYTIAKEILGNSSVSSSSSSSSVSELSLLQTKLESEFALPRDTLHRITRQMINELKRGLESDGATLKQIPSFVTRLPTGQESGSFLALDLGGSNFRVCEVLLKETLSNGGGENTATTSVGHVPSPVLVAGALPVSAGVRVRQRKFTISDALKTGSAKDLFDFLAECVRLFIEEELNERVNANMVEKKLGFTFSFPVLQTALNKGTLITWTKGFSAEGVEKKDVVALLQSAFTRKKLKIKVSALVNDTVGTLISHAYSDPQTYVGVILGTGSNAAYVERIENIPKWTGGAVPSGIMVVNIEWGAFDQEHNVIPMSDYDRLVDHTSLNPGKQTIGIVESLTSHSSLLKFEKMISGMYLGEIVRTVLVDLINTGYIFKKLNLKANELSEKYKFETAYMSRIERDHSRDLQDVKSIFNDIFRISETTLEERQLIKRVCELVGIRAARLSAAGIAAVVTKMNRLDGCTVAIDGSVFEHYPHFANRMRDALHELVGLSSDNVEFALAHDGSGRGAALIAALS